MPSVDARQTRPLSALRKRDERPGRWLWVLLVTLVLEGLTLGLILLSSHLNAGRPRAARLESPRPVSLRNLTSQQWAKNRVAKNAPTEETSRSARNAAETPPEPKKTEARPKGQVVDVAPGNEQKSPDAKYLAEHDNKVQRESKARETTAFYRNAMPNRTTTTPESGNGRDSTPQKQIAGNEGVAQDDRPLVSPNAKQQARAMEVPDVKARQEIALRDRAERGPGADVSKRTESEAVKGNSVRLRMHEGADGPNAATEAPSQGHVGRPGVTNLMPSASTLDKVIGAAPNDHLSDVDDGDGTFLNTKEWKYSSFFNRVKQAVGMHWDPGTGLRQRDPTGNIYAGRDRYTILNVILTEKGSIKEIHVEKSSGIDFLDSEAVASFERSQPFPNPPPGLVESDRTVHFQFGFFLEMGGGPRMRLFRPN